MLLLRYSQTEQIPSLLHLIGLISRDLSLIACCFWHPTPHAVAVDEIREVTIAKQRDATAEVIRTTVAVCACVSRLIVEQSCLASFMKPRD
jgi:hypothetical protein